ncbi:cysteine--tRNA ligase [Candidatus Kaiserbacteria bacterium]|nr:cysteine--tRNA ligase [Candidatus Kaiserbacteria bacterium]
MNLWGYLFGSKRKDGAPLPQIFFTDTLSGKKEIFVSQRPGLVLMYTCGPTMYGPAHIGNLRPYMLSDTAVRALTEAGYQVRRVINITDFGHLVTDGDSGEDKMTKGLRREKLALTMENMRTMAEKYTMVFIDDLAALNIDVEHISFPRASDYVSEQIAFIKTLEQKGYAYRTKDGVYYDTSRFIGYGKLGGIALESQQEGARMKAYSEKRNPADFVLWKPDPRLGWESPWGRGFPGWHIECSTMSRSLLGQELDIHMGGEDLIAIHHNNEIAQSEAISGRTFVHYWMHNAFLTMGGEKASKSVGNVVYLSDVKEKGFHPLALRYFFLQAHYRTPLSFSWDALAAAASALERLWKLSSEVAEEAGRTSAPSEARDQFLAAVRDDLATPQALGILWDSLKSDEYAPEEKWGLLEDAEAHFGLCLLNPPVTKARALAELPADIRELVARREKARTSKDFEEADRLRKELGDRGYHVEDSPDGPVIKSL